MTRSRRCGTPPPRAPTAESWRAVCHGRRCPRRRDRSRAGRSSGRQAGRLFGRGGRLRRFSGCPSRRIRRRARGRVFRRGRRSLRSPLGRGTHGGGRRLNGRHAGRGVHRTARPVLLRTAKCEHQRGRHGRGGRQHRRGDPDDGRFPIPRKARREGGSGGVHLSGRIPGGSAGAGGTDAVTVGRSQCGADPDSTRASIASSRSASGRAAGSRTSRAWSTGARAPERTGGGTGSSSTAARVASVVARRSGLTPRRSHAAAGRATTGRTRGRRRGRGCVQERCTRVIRRVRPSLSARSSSASPRCRSR